MEVAKMPIMNKPIEKLRIECEALGIPVEENDSETQLLLLLDSARQNENYKMFFDENGEIKSLNEIYRIKREKL
jgi:hypothetical protein